MAQISVDSTVPQPIQIYRSANRRTHTLKNLCDTGELLLFRSKQFRILWRTVCLKPKRMANKLLALVVVKVARLLIVFVLWVFYLRSICCHCV